MSDGSIAGARWRTLFLCVAAQNCATGLAFGSFGPLLASTEQHFGITRSVAATGMSLTTLAIGVFSFLLGGFLGRISVRWAMMAGAAVSAVGYLGLATSASFSLALIMYGLIGFGVCLLGVLGPVTLINRWFQTKRGTIISIVNLPIFLLATPFAVGKALDVYDRSTILATFAAVFLVLFFFLWMVSDGPESAADPQQAAGRSASPASDDWPARRIVTNTSFWLISLGIALMAGAGTSFMVHIVAFGTQSGMSLKSASTLLSVYATAGMAGTLIFGWLSDRLGPPRALVISAFCQALMWMSLTIVAGGPLFAIAAVLGLCGVPLVTLQSAALSALVGPAGISRAMGMSYVAKLPFMFFFAPILGLIFERTGNYDLPFQLCAVALALATALFFVIPQSASRSDAERAAA